MDHTVMIALCNNAAVLLGLSVVFEVTYLLPSKYRRMQQVFAGFMIAVICIVVMNIPFTFQPGIIYDTRSILISMTALIFGFVPTVIVAAIAAVFRLSIGGDGMLQGIAVIISSALIGLAWRRWVYPKSAKWRGISIFLMSISVHAVMLVCTFLIPYPENLAVFRAIAVPVMLIYPVASVLLSLLLMRQQQYKNVQEQLKQSEERFRALFDKAPLGYQSLDFEGNFMEVNQQWLDTLGYSRDEVVGKWFGDFLSPAYREAFRERFLIFKTQGQIHSEFEMLHKSGELVFIAFEGKIGYGIDGKFKQTHCILQDITKQKMGEEELRKSEEKYRRLFESMTQGVVYQAADGSILSANPAAEHILGLTYAQMQEKTPMDFDWKTINEDGSEVTGSEHPSMIALRTGKPFGPYILGVFQPMINDRVWLSINAIPLFRRGATTPYQVYTIFQDISAERKANQNYQLLFREMVDGFALHEIICDDQGKPVDYRFLTINAAFEQMTGLKSADILGKTVMEVLPDTEQYWIDTYGRVALTGQPIRFENYTRSTDQYFEVCAYQPSPNQFACTFSDVTKRMQAEEETKKILLRFQSLLNNSPSPIVIIDEKGKIIEVSTGAREMMGLPEKDWPEKEIVQMAPPEIMEKVFYVLSHSPNDNPLLESIDVFEYEGSKRYFESRLFPIHAPDHSERLFGYLAIDVTQRIAAEDALKESEERYSNYIENAPYAVFVINENGHYIDANHSASVITGYSREQLLTMSIRDITAQESLKTALYNFKKLISTGNMSVELQYVHQNGSIRWWIVDAVKLSENRYLGFSNDITEKKEAEVELLHLSNHDFLTGLYNRRYFEAELKRIDDPSQLPLSVIMGDINGVKLINDAFGHAEGDRLIVDAARIISGCCRNEDTVARIGGDEFAILMPKTDGATALNIISK
ncbi:MAG: PAS domain S-box protein, partial [Eubacteriales bacterium]|nr:PAS domain S-box protein [Eubacteriales bacterium]